MRSSPVLPDRYEPARLAFFERLLDPEEGVRRAALTSIGQVKQPATIEANYRFVPGQALNVDASETVCRGGPPSGAHSDIVHPELTWVVLKAGGIVP